MRLAVLLQIAFAAISTASSLHSRRPQAPCRPVCGSFNITRFALYPENSDWDSIHCKLYVSHNLNGSVLVYDLYTEAQEILTFPGITGNPSYHVSGIDFDARTGFAYFAADSGAPFVTSGKNLTGPNTLIKYNTATRKVVFIADMSNFQAQVQNETGIFVSGFQDMAEDFQGNTYYIATYGSAIAKVSPTGKVSVFYAPGTDSSISGFSGIAATTKGNIFVMPDSASQSLVRFSVPQKSAIIETVRISDMPSNRTFAFDGAYFPPKYESKVLLASDDNAGTAVFYSTNDWISARYLGTIVNDAPDVATGTATATVQISDSIFTNTDFFIDTQIDRTVFTFTDITVAVDSLL